MRTIVVASACLLSLGAATWEHSKRTRWIGRWTQKKKFAGQPVDAWLYWCAPPKDTEEWVYMPVMESVAEGLRRFNANASVAYADASTRDAVDIPGRARELRAATGRRALVILFGWWNRRIAKNQALFARLGRDENVYVVLYQSEPLVHAFTVRPSFYGARELWDYSAGNLALLRRRKDQTGPTILRFVPPGYVPRRKLVKGKEVDDATTPARAGFVGTQRVARAPWMKRDAALRAAVAPSPAFGWTAMADLLRRAPLQVVLHRTEQPGYAFESLRGAVLAENRACVLAQKSAPEDEKIWAGVVHFEHSSANLTARIGRLLGDPAALARCRRQTYHVFRHRFDVAAIFRRAKVPDLLQSLGWRRAPPR